MAKVVTFFMLCFISLMACKTPSKPKNKILHAATIGSRGNSLQLYDDGTYTVMCFLFDSTCGRYRMVHDTIYLDRPFKGERCGLEKGSLVIKHEKDSSYWDEKKGINVHIKTITPSSEGMVYEFDEKTGLIDSLNPYEIRN